MKRRRKFTLWHKWPFHILHMGKGHVKASECHSAPSKTDVTVNISYSSRGNLIENHKLHHKKSIRRYKQGRKNNRLNNYFLSTPPKIQNFDNNSCLIKNKNCHWWVPKSEYSYTVALAEVEDSYFSYLTPPMVPQHPSETFFLLPIFVVLKETFEEVVPKVI